MLAGCAAGPATVACSELHYGLLVGLAELDGVERAELDALAAAFVQLDNDREKLIKMGQAGKAKFDQQFEIKNAVKGLVNVYQQVLADSLSGADRV